MSVYAEWEKNSFLFLRRRYFISSVSPFSLRQGEVGVGPLSYPLAGALRGIASLIAAEKPHQCQAP